MCVCVCIYIYIYVHTHTHTHTHIYIYICVCVCNEWLCKVKYYAEYKVCIIDNSVSSSPLIPSCPSYCYPPVTFRSTKLHVVIREACENCRCHMAEVSWAKFCEIQLTNSIDFYIIEDLFLQLLLK